MEDDQEQRPESLLPYEQWIETALRHVVAQAIEHVAVQGLPGGHHFYITFRTDHPGVVIPPRLRAQYPQEMTIVLQHQFWDLKIDQRGRAISVGLSFGGVPSTLVIPLDAVIGVRRSAYPLRVALPGAGARRAAVAPTPPPPARRAAEPKRPPAGGEGRRTGRWSAWTRSAAAHRPRMNPQSAPRGIERARDRRSRDDAIRTVP